MKSEGVLKHFLLAFLLALVCYAVLYKVIEHRRTATGPWEVTFTNTVAGNPVLIVDQPVLAISNVQLMFEAHPFLRGTNEFRRLVFREPRPVPYAVPLGKCVFMDTTFLPGTVTLEILGHEIELLPRVLVIDGKERMWESGSTVTCGSRR